MLARLLGYKKIPKNQPVVNLTYKDTFKKAIVDDTLDEAQSLLENHFDELKLSTRDLNNALYLVSGSAHPKALRTVTELLTRRADPNARRSDDGDTPLFLASYAGNLNIVRELLEAQANPDIGMNDGATPLMIAS